MSKDKRQKDHSDNSENKDFDNTHLSHSHDLADEQRVKILSPSMLVFRRFIRNRLAVVGIFFIVAMFLFSFLGGAIYEYGEVQQFYRNEPFFSSYAGVVDNTVTTEYRYTISENASFNTSARARFILALNSGSSSFNVGEETYSIESYSDSLHGIMSLQDIAVAMQLAGNVVVTPADESAELTDEFIAAFEEAVAGGANNFEADGASYAVTGAGRQFIASSTSPNVLASYNVVAFDDPSQTVTVPFALAAELAFQDSAEDDSVAFEVADETYTLVRNEERLASIFEGTADGEPIATISPIIINPVSPDTHIDLAFRASITEAVDEGLTSFRYTVDAEEEEFRLVRSDNRFTVNRVTMRRILDTFHQPNLSGNHLLGTDGNGMDMIARLMFGGRVSLTIGFIVVALALLIGVTLGGIAGYFGGWIDNIIMRAVDVFYCIPTYPIIIILGAMMDDMRVDSQTRMNYLMLLLGILSWAGIARMVRGQILSLREQEFMVAAEASGISVNRRIFKHLIPNVIPQLIVIATQSLGGTILTEATLSFLGLGVKYPYASWGNIINAVNDMFVMTNYWFVWIPAGFLILVTVLGFNFIGDGLRDAFDPKMKR